MKLDEIKSKGMAIALVSCLAFSTSMLVGCSNKNVENQTSDVAATNTQKIKDTKETKEGDTKTFAPGEHMFSETQKCYSQITQYEGYEIFDIETIGYSTLHYNDLVIIYKNTVEIEATASQDGKFNTPGTPAQKENKQGSKKVLSYKIK